MAQPITTSQTTHATTLGIDWRLLAYVLQHFADRTEMTWHHPSPEDKAPAPYAVVRRHRDTTDSDWRLASYRLRNKEFFAVYRHGTHESNENLTLTVWRDTTDPMSEVYRVQLAAIVTVDETPQCVVMRHDFPSNRTDFLVRDQIVVPYHDDLFCGEEFSPRVHPDVLDEVIAMFPQWMIWAHLPGATCKAYDLSQEESA